MVERPLIVEDEHLEFLDGLRESGEVNMFLSPQALMTMFDLNKYDARTISAYWMETFAERQRNSRGKNR